MIHVELERTMGDFGFVAKDAGGHAITLDSSVENGGADFGIRPMQTLLMALGACSGIDIVSILKKQRQTVKRFTIKITGTRQAVSIPSLWDKINVYFELSGTIEGAKAEKACALSIEKYCSVAETLRRAGAVITWQVKIND